MNSIKTLILCTFAAISLASCNREVSSTSNNVVSSNTQQVEKFLGMYSAAEACSSNQNAKFSIEITPSVKKTDEITISNFGPFGDTDVKATVFENVLTIPAQTISAVVEGKKTDVTIMSGKGLIEGKQMTLRYSYSIPKETDLVMASCSMTCTKN
jgi:hypothetical protein